jgi:hypothetical protein
MLSKFRKERRMRDRSVCCYNSCVLYTEKLLLQNAMKQSDS